MTNDQFSYDRYGHYNSSLETSTVRLFDEDDPQSREQRAETVICL